MRARNGIFRLSTLFHLTNFLCSLLSTAAEHSYTHLYNEKWKRGKYYIDRWYDDEQAYRNTHTFTNNFLNSTLSFNSSSSSATEKLLNSCTKKYKKLF